MNDSLFGKESAPLFLSKYSFTFLCSFGCVGWSLRSVMTSHQCAGAMSVSKVITLFSWRDCIFVSFGWDIVITSKVNAVLWWSYRLKINYVYDIASSPYRTDQNYTKIVSRIPRLSLWFFFQYHKKNLYCRNLKQEPSRTNDLLEDFCWNGLYFSFQCWVPFF